MLEKLMEIIPLPEKEIQYPALWRFSLYDRTTYQIGDILSEYIKGIEIKDLDEVNRKRFSKSPVTLMYGPEVPVYGIYVESEFAGDLLSEIYRDREVTALAIADTDFTDTSWTSPFMNPFSDRPDLQKKVLAEWYSNRADFKWRYPIHAENRDEWIREAKNLDDKAHEILGDLPHLSLEERRQIVRAGIGRTVDRLTSKDVHNLVNIYLESKGRAAFLKLIQEADLKISYNSSFKKVK